MQTFHYLIVGGGMVADAAARGIREKDDRGSIAILSNDVDPPYTRPALSKRLWTDPEFDSADNDMGTSDDTGAEVFLETEVRSIDTSRKIVTTESYEFSYEKLLLASGGVPQTLDLPESERVIYFRRFADYRRLRSFAGQGLEVAVVGGGFIGTELAAALAQNDTKTTLLFDDETLAGSIFPTGLATAFQQMYTDRGITLRSGAKVSSGSEVDGRVTLHTDDGRTVEVDAVAVGLGIEPATELAQASGIAVDDGITVDERLRTSASDVYAAGDVANYLDRILGRRRVEHVDNANQMGTVAGRIMAGSDETYAHTPYFYTKVFDFGYEAVGTLDSRLTMVEDWRVPNSEGVVYYIDDSDRVVGVLLVGIEGKREAARAVLAEDRPLTRDQLVGRIA